ncbi:MAG TPA: fumarylacetoacetate hydrolase family protein, partial [Candidatus Latescibacteria bacterium]|nr:fumarylacetoacetate hydrolase family protein [Candidatus Latescibacterota bacterium]
YREHIAESDWTRTPEEEEKVTPYVFMKPPSTTISGPGDPIVIPKIGRAIDWEVELGVVIGRRGKYIRPEEAYDYIFGYTVVNDVSERKFDAGPRTKPREKDPFFDWLNGKWFDGFAPTGPVVVTKDEVGDPHDLRLTLRVNGEVKQDSNTRLMIFSVPEIVAFVSRMMTLEPGDIIATGTPSGVGDARGEYLKPGDLVEAEVERIGVLRNPVVAEEL